ncbi:hypothetical protein GOP47_0022272 [Adiantum capillus-veneris]|uniref:PWWP domain-containing protein n=1 Tax=Adiantum capillus-veneris TaxID=13818 RepID=A0A9D4U9A8_ADICA|nr:hypothetical protein GOP47_0022272 [Adiantum capillus-veneris]
MADVTFTVDKPHGEPPQSATSTAIVSLKKQTQQKYGRDSYNPEGFTETSHMKVDGPLTIALAENLGHEWLTNRHPDIDDALVTMDASLSECCTSGDLPGHKHENGTEELNEEGAGGKTLENYEEQVCALSAKNVDSSYEFGIGDLVWAKVRSHPWWPAQIYDPAYASASAKKLIQPGKVLVAFFGDLQFAWLLQSRMVAFQPHFKRKVNQTDSKTFRKAIAEALHENCKISESSLLCCHYKGSLHSANSFLNWQSGNDDSLRMQYGNNCSVNAERVSTVKTLMFIKMVACMPFSASMSTLESSELLGHAYGFRACMVALSMPKLSANIEQKKADSADLKHKFSQAMEDLEAALEAKEVGIKRKIGRSFLKDKTRKHPVKRSSTVNGEAESLLALERHQKRKKGRGKCAGLQHHTKKAHRSTSMQEDNAKAFSSPNCCGKWGAEATHQASHKRGPKKRARELSDIYDFVSSDSEEELHEASAVVSKKAKNCLSRMLPAGLNTHSGTKDIIETEGKERVRKVGSVGDSVRKSAVNLSGTHPSLKCINKPEKRSKRMILNRKVHGKVDKTVRLLSKCRIDFCKAPSLQEECCASPVELFQSLQALARDPLNNAGTVGTVTTFLKFRNRIPHKDFGKSSEQIFAEQPDNAVQSLPEEAETASQMLYGELGKDNKEILEVGQRGEFSAEILSKDAHVFADADKVNEEAGQCSKASAETLTSDAQILCAQDKEGDRVISEGDLCRKAFENTFDGDGLLPEAERLHTADSTQTAQKQRPDAVQEMFIESSKQCSTSFPGGQLQLIPVSNRELIEPNILESHGEAFPATPPLIAGSSSTPYDMSIVPTVKLGLLMCFPKDFGLPSVSQLKTMFMQFGPLQPSGVKVCKESACAKVVFKYDQDAKAALKHAKRNALFGPATVSFTLQQFSPSDLWRKSPAFSRGSSSTAHAGGGNLTHQEYKRCAELAISLKQRAYEHLRAASAALDDEMSRVLSGQSARNVNGTRTNPRFNPIEDLVQERMQTLLRRLNLIVGHATSGTK